MDVRGKLVELINQGIEIYSAGYQVKLTSASTIADHLIANGVTVREWISVKDRLPDKDGFYIVTACDEGCSCGDRIWYDTVQL